MKLTAPLLLALFGGLVSGMSLVGLCQGAVTGQPGWILGLACGCVVAGVVLGLLGKLLEERPDDQAYT